MAGFLLRDEIHYFHKSMEDPARPLVAIIGGAKISSKLTALVNLMKHVDKLIIGGAMANTFIKAKGYPVGKSLVDDNLLETAKELMATAIQKKVKFYLPVDCIVAEKLDSRAETKVTPIQEVPDDWLIADIGPATITLFNEALQNAKTVVWNGPMGAFEMDAFSRGTMAMVHNVANSFALTIVGGRRHRRGHPCCRGSQQNFVYFHRAAGPSWNCWRARSFRVSRSWKNGMRNTKRQDETNECYTQTTGGGQLEDAQDAGRSCALAREIRQGYQETMAAEVVLAPPFTALTDVAQEIKGSAIQLAAQDVFWEKQGAYTGAISPGMLLDVGCSLVIIGHSERRQYFGETNETVNKKIKAAQEAGLNPIVCIGETLAQREAQETIRS